MWYVYILECQNKDLYAGVTTDLARRFKEHKSGKGGKFTRTFVAKKVLYSQKYSTKQEALKREAQIKGWTRKKKLALICGDAGLLRIL